MSPTFRFDKKIQRYRYTSGPKSGQFVAAKTLASAIDSYQVQRANNGQKITEKLTKGEVNTKEWMEQIAADLRDSHINIYALGSGGQNKLNSRDYGKIGSILKGEYSYLREFAKEIQNGDLTPAQIKSRVNLYYASVWKTHEISKENSHQKAGYRSERRILGSGKPCQDCLSYQAKGWVKIGSLPAPGDQSVCKVNCRCSKEYSLEVKYTNLLSRRSGWIGASPERTQEQEDKMTREEFLQLARATLTKEDLASLSQQINDEQSGSEVQIRVVHSADSTNENGEEPTARQSTAVDGFYWGSPDAEDLKVINQYTGQNWNSEDWFLFAGLASDSFLWSSSLSVWHLNVLRNMAKDFPGKSLMLDHSSYAQQETKGFVLRTALVKSEKASPGVTNHLGRGPLNAKTVKRNGGYFRVYLQMAVPAHEVELIDRIKSRQSEYLSTGTYAPDAVKICPNCSDAAGKDIPFFAKNDQGKFICPHEIPHPYLLWLEEIGRLPDGTVFADYAVIGSRKTEEHYEISIVGIGNLHAAKLERPSIK